MKIAFLFTILFTASAWAQSQGVVDCKTDYGMPAWESPGSMMQVKQLSCGQKVAILGTTKGFLKIKLSENLIGYIEEKYIKRIEAEPVQADSIPAIVPAKIEKPASEQAGSGKEYIPSQEAKKSETTKPKVERERPILPSGWELGVETSYIQYLEPSIMKEKGVMLGYYANYAFHIKRGFMFKLETRFNAGKVGYSSSDSGAMSGIRDISLENRFLFGADVKISKDTYLTPYSGLGYRYLRDNSREMQTEIGKEGYLRKSNYLYSPIGLTGTTRINKSWRFSAEAEYDGFWHGWQYSDLGTINNANFVAKNDQATGWGVRGGLALIKSYAKSDLSIQPYVRYWDVKDSDVFVGIYEPRNNSREGGIRIGIRF